jgi:inner membrane protein
VLSGIIVVGLLACALRPRSRTRAVAAPALLPAWIGVSLVGKSKALAIARDYARQHGITSQGVDAAPRPASPFNLIAFVFDGRDYHVAHMNTRRSKPLLATDADNFLCRFSAPFAPAHLAGRERLPRFGDDDQTADLAREVWAHPEFGFFRWFAMFQLVHAVENGDRTCVGYRDLRFQLPGRSDVSFRYGMRRSHGSGQVRDARRHRRPRRFPIGAGRTYGAIDV